MEKKKDEEKSPLEIKIENLNLPSEVSNYDAKNMEDYFEFIFNLLNSTNFSYIKFGIFLTRKQMTLQMNPPIKAFLERGIIQQLMSNLETKYTDEQVVVISFF